jgi:hypothetical protein
MIKTILLICAFLLVGATAAAAQQTGGSLVRTNNVYPASGIPISAAATGTTGAVTATLGAFANQTTFLCGFDVSAIGGTATVGPITISGLVSNQTFTYQLSSTTTGATLSRTLNPCIPGRAVNTAITITTTANGTATAVDVNAWGFYQ